MMREVLFRAKKESNGQWVYGGSLIQFFDDEVRTAYMPMHDEKCKTPFDEETGDLLGFDDCLFYKIQMETFGEYTGMRDRFGIKIFEGDVVEAWSEGSKAKGVVKKRKDGLWLMYPAWQNGKSWGLYPDDEGRTRVEVMGNIHDNPRFKREDTSLTIDETIEFVRNYIECQKFDCTGLKCEECSYNYRALNTDDDEAFDAILSKLEELKTLRAEMESEE